MASERGASTQWVIVIFLPPSDIDEPIRRYREAYDPLARHIAPHVTLVHPFIDEASPAELRDHVARIAAMTSPFDMTPGEITPFPDGYIYLNVKTGNDAIVDLRDRLYSGMLASHKSRRNTFVPHVTIGRTTDDTLDRAMADADQLDIRAELTISEISAYRFDEHDQRVLDFAVPLGAVN